MSNAELLLRQCREMAVDAKLASRELVEVSGEQVDLWLSAAAEQLIDRSDEILVANSLDTAGQQEFGLTDAQVDRLRLDQARIESIAAGLRNVAALPSPIGQVFGSTVRPNGLLINKVRVPLGVVFFVYESRPNVTADAAAICVKSGNAVILRGGKEAAQTSSAIVKILGEVGKDFGIPEKAVQRVTTIDRMAVDHFLSFGDLVDLAIPRGGAGLIQRVAENATMPVIKHFSGNCHVYVDQHANQEMALAIIENSKFHRLGVCNAAESLLVHQSVAKSMLPKLAIRFKELGGEIRGDKEVCKMIDWAVPAEETDWETEFLDAVISVAVVPDLQNAIGHINEFGSGHTDAIVSDSVQAIQSFTKQVDSAAVMVNCSTRFNDGGEFGLGAEIGISTDKFHARGPCGLEELTTYKYVCVGQGHIR
ncbi:MAG: glutamate-5-semialdehyde dehydrogenase [Pirellulaceae bacterium]|jgi:glutamate-5-semialdehyde dehydrogenase|nr:glutamate-5-semialdehyde dehydrogenase [Pirellulaceae bacterium]